MRTALGFGVAYSLYILQSINSSVTHSIRVLKNTDKLLEPVESIDDIEFIGSYQYVADWAAENGFVKEAFFLAHTQTSGVPIKCASWWSEEHHCYLLFYLAKNSKKVLKNTDFVTWFKPNTSLTTCSTSVGVMLPRSKNRLVQCSIGSLGLQFEQHKHSTRSIAKKYRLTINHLKYDLFRKMEEALKEQAAYISNIPLWQFRGFYWYLIRRHLIKNQTY